MASIAKRAPLYEEASTQLLQRIANRELKPGIALPNETELSAELGVSVGTVRRALDQLEADRLLIRQQGRGTFVSEQAREEFVSRFSNVRCQTGKPLSDGGRLLSQALDEAAELERFHLKLRPAERVLRTRRLLEKHSRVYMHEAATLSLRRFGDIRTEDVGNYALSVLALERGIRLARATERVAPCRAPQEVAELLGLDADALVLHLDRVVFTTCGEPVEWRVGYCSLKDQTYVVSMN
jgi:GntR family transcriptional regulator